MEKLTLANIQLFAAQIIDQLETDGGEITEETAATLEMINNKLLAGAFAVDKVKQNIADKKAMIKELQASVKRDEKKREFLEGAVLRGMQAAGVSKMESYKKISVAKKPGRVELWGEVPPQYQKAKIEFSFDLSNAADLNAFNLLRCSYKDKSKITTAPDKTAIKAAIKAGEAVPGAELIENEFSLRIK